MRNVMAIFTTILGMLVITSGYLANAQPTQATVQGAIRPETAEVRVSPGDIPALIESLAGGLPIVTQTRYFANGEQIEGYAAPVQWAEGSFDTRTRTLTILGTVGGSPIVEELRFIALEDAFYVLGDTYLDQESIERASGRGLPYPLRTDLVPDQARVLRSDGLSAAAKPQAVMVVPTITSVGGNSIGSGSSIITSNGKIEVGSCGAQAYNGQYIFDTIATSATGHPLPTNVNWPYNIPYLIVKGSNFGTTKGTVKFGPLTLTAASQVSGQPAIVSWSTTQIVFVPGMPVNSSGPGPQQGASMAISVTTSTGTPSAVYGVSALPAIGTRVYGQCTWYSAYKRILSGKNPPDAAYPEDDPYGSARWHSIDATYVPQLYDVFVWKWSDNLGSHEHTGIAVKVAQTSASKTTSAWSITLGEMNYDCKSSIADLNNGTPLTSTFQVNLMNGRPVSYTWPTSTHAKTNLVPYSYYR